MRPTLFRMQSPSFTRFGDLPPASPVVMSVPHAGRDYPPALREALRVPFDTVVALEDRHIDIVATRARTVETMIVQTRARAWIDLNRSEAERDPRVDEGANPMAQPQPSAKLRSGLGLVPRRAAAAPDLWRRRFTDADISSRIANDHRPYHDAVHDALAAAQARFGIAILLDVHSMPPLSAAGVPGGSPPRIVLGDRFGRSADTRFLARLETEIADTGLPFARNAPYAGGHILERHARPTAGIHAIQLEFDRSLYLDRQFDGLGTGVDATVRLLKALLTTLTNEALAMAASATTRAAAAE
jgi:N-formylglutamate amidohydrolase